MKANTYSTSSNSTTFRTWKSGKMWLYSASILAVLVGGTATTSHVFAATAQAPATTATTSTAAAPASSAASSLTASSMSTAAPSSAAVTPTLSSTASMVASALSSTASSVASSSAVSSMASASSSSAGIVATSTTVEAVQLAVANNIKNTATLTASELTNANYPGPFTAGVNQVIPFEAFGGDGMLTRLLLNASDGAPWSDNGTAKNPALLPVAGLASGEYFYEVDLAGTNGLTGAALLNYLKMQGTASYQATVKVYAADKMTLVATKALTVNLTGLTDNIKASTTVTASELANANYPGPFTAGVNQVIPFEAFGGDGMLTRLLLNASDGAPWSDNGTAKNPALLPLAGLASGQYFYEVDLAGTNGLTGAALLNYLKMQGTASYQATVKIYAADKTTLIATKMITVNLTGMDDMNTAGDNGNTMPMSPDTHHPMMMNPKGKGSSATQKNMKMSPMATTAKTLPQTGDSSQTSPIVAGFLILLASLGLTGFAVKRRKQQ